MKTIGFTNTYYTLWEVSEDYKHYHSTYEYETRRDCWYLQNLSKTLEGAKAKMKGDYKIDLELRGQSSFVWSSGEKIDETPEHLFKFGKYQHSHIAECLDLEYVFWYYQQDQNSENKHIEDALLKHDNYKKYRGLVRTLEQIESLKAHYRREKLEKGHFFNPGDKVELEIKEVGIFSFMGAFGTTYVVSYESKCGKLFKYMGGSPNYDIKQSKFTPVKATIKHAEYQEQPETRLQRIKIK